MLRDVNGPLAYAVFYSLSMTAFVVQAVWLSRRNRLPVRIGVALGLCYIWSMNTGARILYDTLNHRFDWSNYFRPAYYTEPGMWGGPLVYLAIAAVGTLLWARDRRRVLDIAAFCLPVPMILAKLACFAHGCCYGAPCSMPWAVTFPEGGTPRTAPAGVPLHPTQLYEVFALTIIGIVFLVLDKKRWRGTFLAWFILLYGIGRPIAEFFRAPERFDAVIGPLTLSQALALSAAFVAGLVLLFTRHLGVTDPPPDTPERR